MRSKMDDNDTVVVAQRQRKGLYVFHVDAVDKFSDKKSSESVV